MVCNKHTTTDVRSRHTPPQLHLSADHSNNSRQPSEPNRTEQCRPLTDSFKSIFIFNSKSSKHCQNIRPLLLAVFSIPPTIWRYLRFKSPLYPKFFNPPLYHRKRNFISIGKQFFWIGIIYELLMIKLKSVILISIAH